MLKRGGIPRWCWAKEGGVFRVSHAVRIGLDNIGGRAWVRNQLTHRRTVVCR